MIPLNCLEGQTLMPAAMRKLLLSSHPGARRLQKTVKKAPSVVEGVDGAACFQPGAAFVSPGSASDAAPSGDSDVNDARAEPSVSHD